MLAEFITIFLDVIKEEGIEQLEVMGIAVVKEMELFKVHKKCPPALGKVTAPFQPESFNASVVGRPSKPTINV